MGELFLSGEETVRKSAKYPENIRSLAEHLGCRRAKNVRLVDLITNLSECSCSPHFSISQP